MIAVYSAVPESRNGDHQQTTNSERYPNGASGSLSADLGELPVIANLPELEGPMEHSGQADTSPPCVDELLVEHGDDACVL